MISNYLTLFKALAFAAVLSGVAYYSYDYGIVTTQAKSLKAQNALWDKVEEKQSEAFLLAVKLANQKPDIRIQFREIKKEVIKYAQKNSSKHCVIHDADWLRIRAQSVRAHNRAIGIQHSSSIANGASTTASSYGGDSEILAEDVENLQTCTENAKQLLLLQTWIKTQIPSYQEP